MRSPAVNPEHCGECGADALAGKAAENVAWSTTTSLAHMTLKISAKYRKSKETWDEDPRHHGTEEIPSPPAKTSCMDRARNAIARTAAQMRTGHWRSAVYFRRTRKRKDDTCRFWEGKARMTRSHALRHCPNATLAAARVEAWEGRNPGRARVQLANPRWESGLLRFRECNNMAFPAARMNH
jgi:hypothetical protein